MCLNAQKFDWVSFTPLINATSFGGSGGISVTTDNQGNIYTVAVFNDPIIVGTDTLYHVGNVNRPDILITKWNPQGEVISYRHIANWSGNGNPEPQVIMYDELRNEILLTISSYYFGMQVTLLSNGVETDTLLTLAQGAVLRLKTDLSFVSTKDLPGGTSYGTPSAVKDGFLYAAQGYNSTVSKTDTAGNVLWSITPAISNFHITDLAVSNNDTIFVIGYINGTTVSMGGKTVVAPSAGNLNQVGIFKIDTAGNVIQGAYLTQASYYIFALRLTTDLAGNVFVATTYDIQLLQVGSFTLSISPNGRDVFVAKLSPDLVPLWVKEFSSNFDEQAFDIVVHPSGKVMLLGNYSGNTTFGNFTFPPANSGYLAQLDNSTGDILYAKNFGVLTGGFGGSGHPVCATIVGNKYYITGVSYGSNEYDPNLGASYGCFNQTRNRQYLTCFNDTAQPLPKTNFTFIREQNSVFFSSNISSGEFVSIDFGDGTSTTTQVNPTHVYSKGFYTAVLTTKFDCFVRKDTIKLLFKGIQSVTPKQIANNQLQILFIKGGFPFADSVGVTVKLKRGNTVLNDISVAVSDSGTIQANFMLSNEPLGFYDVIVNGPNGFTDTLFNGIEMEPERIFLPEVQIVGLERRLVNRIYPYQVIVTNPSNVIQFGVPVYVALHKDNQILRFSNRVVADSLANIERQDHFTHDFIMAYDSLSNDSIWLGIFVIPFIYPGSSEVIDFYIKGTTLGDKGLFAVAGKPMYDSTQLNLLGLRTSCDFLADPAACVFDLLGQIPGVSCVTNALSAGCAIGNLLRDVAGKRNKKGEINRYVSDVFNLVADISGILTCEAKDVFGVSDFLENKLAANITNLVFGTAANMAALQTPSIPLPGGFNIPGSCGDAFGKKGFTGGLKSLDEFTNQRFFIKDVSSLDPNIKIGPLGTKPENYFYGQERVNYTIYFENIDTATAPASVVEIYDTLDASFFDVSTLQFTGFGFDTIRYQILHATNSYAQEIDLRPAKNTIVRFEAKLDSASNSLIWKFNSYNPQTRELVLNVNDGFLNPNANSPEGEGYVSFSILPKPNRPHLQQVSNRAKIVFDENAPIFTDYWLNTVDKLKPSSNVNPLPATYPDTLLLLTWTGNDAHSGVKHYDIYYTENDTATYILFNHTPLDSGYFVGNYGSTYKFFSIATDFAGNREDAAANPDAVITLQQSPISIPIVSELEFSIYPNPAQSQLTLQTNTTEQVSVELIDLQGRVVKRDDVWSKKSMDVSTLSNGVYQVKFTSPQGVVVKRFLKE